MGEWGNGGMGEWGNGGMGEWGKVRKQGRKQKNNKKNTPHSRESGNLPTTVCGQSPHRIEKKAKTESGKGKVL